MAKNNTPEVKTQQKVQTKYDRKMEARRQQKLKDERQAKLTKMIAAAVGIVIVAAIVFSIVSPIIKKNQTLSGTYVKVGEHELTKLEYDYYYETTVNNYLNSMSSILPYLGLDTSGDFSKQQYTETMTWKDLFDEMTVEQIKQTKAHSFQEVHHNTHLQPCLLLQMLQHSFLLHRFRNSFYRTHLHLFLRNQQLP